MSEWKEYIGSEEQLKEIMGCKKGFALKSYNGVCATALFGVWPLLGKLELKRYLSVRGTTHYLICNPHPLADMVCQPRRIVLEEDINDNRNPSIAQTLKLSSGRIMHIFCPYAVREVKETDNVKMGVSQGDGAEPKLSLSVDECKEAMRKLETFNVTDLSVKICRFLKESS